MADRNDEEFHDTIVNALNHIGVEAVHASFENVKTKNYFECSLDYRVYRDQEEVDYSILEAVGLIRRVETNFIDVGLWSLSLVYYHLTDLGFYFAKACGIVRANVPPLVPVEPADGPSTAT